MAKRNSKVAREGRMSATSASNAEPAEGMEQRVLAFAKQVGYVAGTIEMKAGGLIDRKALTKQLTSVRDGAAHLIEQLGNAARLTRKRTPARSGRKATRVRSGGVVDAPGKKHRKRLPSDPDATLAGSQARKIRAATPMEKTTTARHRNRG
jgi:hypothetical protein